MCPTSNFLPHGHHFSHDQTLYRTLPNDDNDSVISIAPVSSAQPKLKGANYHDP